MRNTSDTAYSLPDDAPHAPNQDEQPPPPDSGLLGLVLLARYHQIPATPEGLHHQFAPAVKELGRSAVFGDQEIQLAAKYGAISTQWRRHWIHLVPLFDYPDEIRRVIYTTNAIESLNRVIRKAINNRKLFPDDKSVMKVVYLAIKQASRKWTMPIRDWKPALNRFFLERS